MHAQLWLTDSLLVTRCLITLYRFDCLILITISRLYLKLCSYCIFTSDFFSTWTWCSHILWHQCSLPHTHLQSSLYCILSFSLLLSNQLCCFVLSFFLCLPVVCPYQFAVVIPTTMKSYLNQSKKWLLWVHLL